MKHNWDKKSNNQILLEIQQMKYNHEELKQHLIQKFDELVEIEEKFDEANTVIYNRLTGKKMTTNEYKEMVVSDALDEQYAEIGKAEAFEADAITKAYKERDINEQQ